MKSVSLSGQLVTPSEIKACLMGISHFDLATDNKRDLQRHTKTHMDKVTESNMREGMRGVLKIRGEQKVERRKGIVYKFLKNK